MIPRVAFFTDSFHEANGVALTSREFARFAHDRYYPLFSVHAGPRTVHLKRGRFETFELANSRVLLRLEHDLAYDLLFSRHRAAVAQALAKFRPDLVHITGPGHMGMLGAILAYQLRVPLVASWHTNVHEFGARRLRILLNAMPDRWRDTAARWAEDASLCLSVRFYQLARLTFAPNPELVTMLRERTNRPCYLMQRGIDTNFFTPARRKRKGGPFVIGYVGRLSPEKNVRLLARIDEVLRKAGITGFRFLICGDGSEREWLKSHLASADLPGVIKGDALADAYASMDAFVFPSETDTFGNVILEAMASGVPPIVSDFGGPKFLVEDGVTGRKALSPDDFARMVIEFLADEPQRQKMATAAREAALGRSWSAVFEGVYAHYTEALEPCSPQQAQTAPVSHVRPPLRIL
jgi:phosphatidylinositol alpha 1,6-mannosyltransferase